MTCGLAGCGRKLRDGGVVVRVVVSALAAPVPVRICTACATAAGLEETAP